MGEGTWRGPECKGHPLTWAQLWSAQGWDRKIHTMKVALAGRSAPAAVRSQSNRPSATARPAPKPFLGQQLTIACHPLHRLRSPLSPPPPPLPLRLWPRQAESPRPTSLARSPTTLPNPAARSRKKGGGTLHKTAKLSSDLWSVLSPATNSPAAVRASGGSHTAHHRRAASGGGCQRHQTRTHTQRESYGQKGKIGHPSRGQKGVGPCPPSP